MKRAVLYLRVSTVDQTTANQERELREIAGRMGLEVVKVYKDHGISGANNAARGRNSPIRAHQTNLQKSLIDRTSTDSRASVSCLGLR